MLSRSAIAGAAVWLVAFTGCSRTAGGESVTVFAASSLNASFDRIASAFEAEHPDIDVVITSAGSNTLSSQIAEGAPADVFASADAATMKTLVDGGLVSEPTVFAHNRLEIAVEAGNPYDIDGVYSLGRSGARIALCAPEVPCGAYTSEVLEASGVELRPVTLETNVTAVVTKIRLGEVDAGLVYHTDVVAADGVDGVDINTDDNVTTDLLIATVANDGTSSDGAAAFVDFVLGEQGQRILGEAGFDSP